MSVKFKDPIYGYIRIEEANICEVIDSPLFHRLEDVIQTSYSSVYPSSLHNRFVHSIGVFYLGRLAVDGIKANGRTYLPGDFDELADVFKLACLMHDLGHSPFSHTGEKYYMLSNPNPWDLLKQALNDGLFNRDASSIVGAPHEIMSALESIKKFAHIIPQKYRDFFVRCIIGLKYQNCGDVRNCFIELLNSKTIDVDKLDYLIRDSYFTGFKTVSIDFERLLSSLCILKTTRGFKLAYTKAGLSTLESVILAHDMERKWIQNHPTIQYESLLLETIISRVIASYSEKSINLFSLNALTSEGVEDDDGFNVRLLSDSDILYTAKNKLFSERTVQEYFVRENRRKPLWKTEAEYRSYFENDVVGSKAYKKLEEMLFALQKTLDNYLKIASELPLLNDAFLIDLEGELKKIQGVSRIVGSEGPLKLLYEEKEKNLNKVIGFLNVIKDFSQKNSYRFDYAFIATKQFYSSFNKDELSRILIHFDENKDVELGKVVNLFGQEKPKENFFYFYVNKDDRQSFDVSGFAKVILQYAMQQCWED
ncbi:MAG: HD domain-containing protein [Fibrobacter sp.]|nr:HD domain-containing protein [Fibrobacter sp.]